MFKNPKVMMLIISALVIGAILTITMWKQPILGLDLRGGTRLTLQAMPTDSVPQINSAVMDSLHTVIEKRVNGLGVAEAVVQKAGKDRLLVEIPGVTDPVAARKTLGKVGNLEFKKQVNNDWVPSGVSGKDLAKAGYTKDTSGWMIEFELTGEGAKKFATLTTELARNHEPLGIFFDGEMQSAPAVQTPILQGKGVITGSFTLKEVQDQSAILNAGALPADIEIIEENTVGPLLGEASIHTSLFAGAVGLGLVMLFMIILYRTQGIVADLALLIYTLLTYAIFLWVPVTFTLSGIAGFILSIGMAVDANILIFERTKEELKAGRSVGKAVEVGFDRAFPSIFDSNTTTAITCLLLIWLGTGTVKGFAVTLLIGVAVSMFSAITVTRTFLMIMMGSGAAQPGAFGMSSEPPAELATAGTSKS